MSDAIQCLSAQSASGVASVCGYSGVVSAKTLPRIFSIVALANHGAIGMMRVAHVPQSAS